MAFTPIRKVLPATGGTFILTFTDTINADKPANSWDIDFFNENETDFSVTITNSSTTSCTMSITAQPNNSTVVQQHTFYLVKMSAGAVPVRYRYAFSVEVDYSKTIYPVYQDTYFTDTTNSVLAYTINTDGNAIYSGKAYMLPSTNQIIFNINNIASNYLNSHLPDGINIGYTTINDYTKKFEIVSNGQTIGEYRFYNDWSYKSDFNEILSTPIKNVLDKNQYLICSLYTTAATATNFTFWGGQGDTLNSFYEGTFDNTAQSVVINDGFNAFDKVVLQTSNNTIVWDVIDSCAEYCLYYCNGYGGWDSFLVEGNVIKKDKIEKHFYTKDYNNTTHEFGRVNYLNVIVPTYTLYTNYLTDDEQSRMWHLAESNEVYLHNLKTGEILPVNITNTEYVWKTFTNQGRHKHYDTITIEVAQDKLRK